MTAPAATGRIIRVVDGDTVWVATRLRLTRNAPELNSPEGRTARATLEKAYPRGRDVRFTVRWVDAYGRIVAELL
jgi:endonuclease YncB( thermonuclease family)